METQPYHQAAPQEAALARDLPMPRALRLLVPGAVVSSILLLALPAVMLIDRSATYAAIRADQPGLDPNNLDFAFAVVMSSVVAVHVIDVVAVLWLSLKASRGRQWARTALSITLGVFLVGSVFSSMAWSGAAWAVIPGQVIHLVMLAVLWVPRPVRDVFTAHRSAADAS